MDRAAQKALLQVAQEAIARAASGGPPPELPEDEALMTPRGAFVTLHDRQGVRGCVGTTDSSRPLVQVVQAMAVAAATRDPRFSPVTPAELAGLRIEISVLQPMQPISKLEEVQLGRDGLVVEGRGRRGLLLPQVATSRDWDLRRFARSACAKAGLFEEAYLEEDVRLYRFGAEVFGSSTKRP